MNTITKQLITINGNIYEKYPYQKNYYNSIKERLRAEYTSHENFYKENFNVDKKDAEMAGWHPEDIEFSNDCEGFKKFIQDKGVITKTETLDTLSINDLFW